MPLRSFARVRTAVLLAAIVVGGGCGNPFSSNETWIRLRNSSSFELTAVTFSPGSATIEFTRIGPGETTEYQKVDNAYPYGYLDLLVGGQRRIIQPIDYVGESYIGDGRFTFVITIDPTTRNPTTTLVED